MSNIRRITATINTIPAYTALTGNVTSNSTDTKVLNYSGTDDWLAIFNRPEVPPAITPNPFATDIQMIQDPQSKIWLYVPSGQHLVHIIGAVNTATNTWALQLATALPGLISAPCNYVKADLLGYYFLNDGGATGTANGVSVLDGEWLDDAQLAPKGERVTFLAPVLIDASGTDFLVTESK